MYGRPPLTYNGVITWINRVRLPNLLVVSSRGNLSVLVDASVVSTYICTGTVLLFVFVYIPGIFGGGGHVHARFTAVYAHNMCN